MSEQLPFRIKRSAVEGKRPQNEDLELGELALNTYDGRLFAKKDTGGVGVGTTVTLLTPWTENIGGGLYYNEGNVGLGTTTPSSKLTVQGDGKFTGVVTATTFIGNLTGYATNAGIATYAPNAGIATYATNAGIATYATNAGIATYATNAGIATYATNAGIATNVIGGIASVTSLFVNTLGISTLGTVKISSGIVTATTGVVTYYGDGSNLTNLPTSIPVDNIATNSPRAITFIPTGVATTSRIGVNLNYLSFVPSNGGLLGINTNNPQYNLHVFGDGRFVGNVTANNFYGTASYATTSGIATYATNLKNGSGGQIPYQSAADNTTFLANGSAGNLLQSNGGTSAPSWTSPQGLTIGYANTAGIATFATNAGIATFATNAGISTFATNAGIATFATTAGISTNVIGGIASVTQLNVSGVSTFTNGPVLIGSATSTGTAAQPLQVSGGAYVSGNAGIGTTNPTSKLTVVGDVLVVGVVTATDFNSASDAKLKTNIQPIADPLEKVTQIQGVSFNWIKDNKPSMGVIADELQKVLPELVSDTDPKTVNYNGLIGLLIEVVKEQQEKIQSLEQRITRLE